MTYPIKFREHVLSIRKKESLTFEEAATRFGIGRATLTRWSKSITPVTYKRKPRKIDPQKLAEDIKIYPDSYQSERAERFGVSPEAMCRALKRFGFTYKKNSKSPQSR